MKTHDQIEELAPTDAEILTLLPTVKLKDEDPKRMVWLTRKDALKFVRAVLTKFGTPAITSQPIAAPAGILPVASKSHGAWDGIEDVLELPDGTDIYTAAQVQAMGCVPPGWQAVPVELDDDIAEAIAMTANCCGGGAYDIWRAALAAAPSGPARQPLTDEQIERLAQEHGSDIDGFARAIETAHGITAAQAVF